jgi:hemoglobin/transferrin/lactoferrin receptor protein
MPFIRAGHLQNVITIDQNMLERVEVLYGPASTLYGSDALGGVLHFRSKQPNYRPMNRCL